MFSWLICFLCEEKNSIVNYPYMNNDITAIQKTFLYIDTPYFWYYKTLPFETHQFEYIIEMIYNDVNINVLWVEIPT